MNSFSSTNHLWERKIIILGATGNPQRPRPILIVQLWERRSAKHYSRPLKLTSLHCTPCFLLPVLFKFFFKNLQINQINNSQKKSDAHLSQLQNVSSSMGSSVPHYLGARWKWFYTSAHWDFSMKCSRVNNECSERLQASLHCGDKGASFPCKHSIWIS